MLGWALNLGFAGSGEVVVTKSTPQGGGHILPEISPRKFTKKDENELKRLLLEIVEKEKHDAQERRAEELARLRDSEAGIKRAVNEAEKAVRKQALNQQIQWDEAKRRIEELEEEEDMLLILASLL
jgi:hypothetical protein